MVRGSLPAKAPISIKSQVPVCQFAGDPLDGGEWTRIIDVYHSNATPERRNTDCLTGAAGMRGVEAKTPRESGSAFPGPSNSCLAHGLQTSDLRPSLGPFTFAYLPSYQIQGQEIRLPLTCADDATLVRPSKRGDGATTGRQPWLTCHTTRST
jgi:hypothetical protein